jgi:hypothetical protein
MEPDDLDHALVVLAQHLADTSFSLRVILELRRSADNLTMPLAAELRSVRLMISRVLPHLPGDRP